MKRAGRIIRNLILFFGLIILTFSIIFKDQDVTQIFSILESVKKEYVVIAILFMSCYIICDAINIGRTLKALNEKSSFLKNIKYSLIGFFFSSITPAASGGQPMQIYYMHKENISVASSTLALLINLSCMQIVTISVAIISLIFNIKYMNPVLIWFFVIGIALNASALALLVTSIYSKRMTKGLINFSIKVLKFFRVKNIESKKEKLENELKKYHDSAKYIKGHMKVIVKTLLTTYLQFFFYYSISYWVYRSFGLSGHSIFAVLSMQAVLYGTVSGIPSPGAVGVSEGGYLALFEAIYPHEFLNSAMLLNRGVNFYLFVAISALIVIINTLRIKKQLNQNEIKQDINEV